MIYINPRNRRFRAKSQGKTSFLTQGVIVASKGSSSSPPSQELEVTIFSWKQMQLQICPYHHPRGFERGMREVIGSAPAHSTVSKALTQRKISYSQVQAHTCFMGRMAKCLWPRAAWVLPFSLSCVTRQDYDMLLAFSILKQWFWEKHVHSEN